MPAGEPSEKKKLYFSKLSELVENYPKIFIVEADHVGSKQISKIRFDLRNKAVMLMGKNTMIKTCLREKLAEMPQLEKLINSVKMNIGFVFCIEDPSEIRNIIMDNKVPAPAKQGVVSPNDVTIPAGPTGMDPTQTSFFQALGIPTKIVKAQIEIQNDIHLIKKGEKVTASQTVLLQKLNIKPFTYGLIVKYVYDDGSVYDAEVLDISDEVILQRFSKGVNCLAAFSRGVGIPTQPSVPHSIIEGFKNCAAFAIGIDYIFPQCEPIKNYLDNPDAFVSAAPAAAAAATGGAKADSKLAEAEKPKEEEEEEDEDMGFSLFD